MTVSEAVTNAAAGFEARWTMLALKRVDPQLYEALNEQRELYYQATVHGDEADIARHGIGLTRGYMTAVRVMEDRRVPDDAYMVGRYNGLVVLISDQKAVQARTMDFAGEKAIVISPDEVALLVSSVNGLAALKQLFPGAETIDRYPEEGS